MTDYETKLWLEDNVEAFKKTSGAEPTDVNNNLCRREATIALEALRQQVDEDRHKLT